MQKLNEAPSLLADLCAPEGWVNRPDQLNPQLHHYLQTIGPPEDCDVRISSFSYKTQVRKEDQACLDKLLASPAQQLEPVEAEKMRGLLGHLVDPDVFVIEQFRTVLFGDNRVLHVLGRYAGSGEKTLCILVKYGICIHQIFFQAPPAKFQKYKAAAEKCIDATIKIALP